MAYDIEPIEAEKGRIVRDLFVDTADDNYITARWCFAQGLSVDYSWLAVHALEKYMKAALLLNGRSGRGYRDATGKCRSFRHDIVKLYECVKSFASDLLPICLKQPGELDIDLWRDEAPDAFIHRLYRNGNADNRYQIFGFVKHHEDLYKFDLMVFALRRVCVPLDAYFLGKWRPEGRNLTYRDVLTKQPRWWTVSSVCKLERTMNGKRGELLREVLLNLNLPFAPNDFSHGSLRSSTAAHNPVLARSILGPLKQTPDGDAVSMALKLRDWALEKLPLPRDVKKQLRDATRQGENRGIEKE